jgi:glycosyltransferase involved in cell wall biosynthesis
LKLARSASEPKQTTPIEPQLSIVIPAYNEEGRLPGTVLETILWTTTRNHSFELIIVDDGSRDETLACARHFEESDSRVRALSCPHRGKGAAVRTGMLSARGDLVLFMDADGATPRISSRCTDAATRGSSFVADNSVDWSRRSVTNTWADQILKAIAQPSVR